MKNRKRSAKIICLMLTVVMVFTILPVWAVGEGDDWERQIINPEDYSGSAFSRRDIVEENLGSIQATFTSAIDNSPFWGFFQS